MKKRLLSMILAVSMVLTFLPVSAVTAFADSGTLLDDLAFDASGAPVNKNDETKTEGNGWKKWKSTAYPYKDVLLLNGDSNTSYYISDINYPVVVMNEAEAPNTAGSIDGTFSKKVTVVGGSISGGHYTSGNNWDDKVELWLGTNVYGGTFENMVYLEGNEFYTKESYNSPSLPNTYNNIYGGYFKKGICSNNYGAALGNIDTYKPRVYGGTFCESVDNEDDFVGHGTGYSPEVYGGVFEKIDTNNIKASDYYTLSIAQDCTINEIITSGSAVIVPNADTASKDTYPTKVTLHYTGNDAVLYWNVVYSLEGADISEDTVSLNVWSSAKDITGADTDTVTFTAKPNSTDVYVYPVTVAKKKVTLNSSVSEITAKTGTTDLTITDNQFEAAYGQDVTITAPALPEGKAYQWTVNGNTVTEGISSDGNSYTFKVGDNATIGLEILDKTPASSKGDTNSTTLKNALLKKVVSDKQDITDSIQKNADGSYNIPIGAKVTVVFDKSAFADSGSKFSYWKITGLTQDEANQYNKQESFTFIMPENAVTLEAMTQDDSIEDDGPDVLGTAAIIGTAVVGTAVLAYSGHQLGTELYLTYLLPSGAVIPANRIQLAMLLWQDAGNPAPVDEPLYSDIDADDADAQNAAQWAVEAGLMELPDADNAPGQFDPYASVSHTQVIHAWKKAQSVKG